MTITCNKNIIKLPNSYIIKITIAVQYLLQFTICIIRACLVDCNKRCNVIVISMV